MISIYDIKNWSDVAAFLIWTLAVCAIAKATFGSLIAAEIQYRFSLRDAPRRQKMSRLNWEINNRAAWNEDVARRSPHAAKQPLADSEIETRRAELQQLARSSLGWRVITYFMGCFACQTFWTAMLVFAATRGLGDLVACILTPAACSGATLLIPFVRGWIAPPRGGESAVGRAGCKSCGK